MAHLPGDYRKSSRRLWQIQPVIMANPHGDYGESGRGLWRIVWVVMANRTGGYGEGGGWTIPPLCKRLIFKGL